MPTPVSANLAAAQTALRAAQQKGSPGDYDVTIDEAKDVFAKLKSGPMGAAELKFAMDLYSDELQGSDKAATAYTHNFVNKYVVQAGKLDDEQRKNFVAETIGDAYNPPDDSLKYVVGFKLAQLPQKLQAALSGAKAQMQKDDPKANVDTYEVRLGENDKTIVAYVVQSINNEDPRSAAGSVEVYNPSGTKIDNWDDVEC
jgi:hypothetical protein